MSEDRPKEVDIIDAWMVGKGTEVQYQDGVGYIKFWIKEYKNTFPSLIQSFLDAGYSEDEIRGPWLISRLKKLLVPSENRQKGFKTKISDWQDKIEEAWEYQCRVTFGREKSQLLKEAKAPPPSVINIKTEEEGPVWIPPKGKLDMKTFKGFETVSVDDDDFIKVLEGIKNGG
jgi:hypothetical protein